MEITKAVTELNLLATPEGLEGAGSVTLKVLNRESAQMNRWILLAMIPALHWLRRKMISGRYRFRTRQRRIYLLPDITVMQTMRGVKLPVRLL